MARVKGAIVYTIGAGYGGYKKTALVLYLALLFCPGANNYALRKKTCSARRTETRHA